MRTVVWRRVLRILLVWSLAMLLLTVHEVRLSPVTTVDGLLAAGGRGGDGSAGGSGPLVSSPGGDDFTFAAAAGCHHLGLDGHPSRVPGDAATQWTDGVIMSEPFNATEFLVVHCKWAKPKMHPDFGFADRLLSLPRRTVGPGPTFDGLRYYVVYAPGLWLDDCSRRFSADCSKWYDVFMKRDDVLYVMMERGEARLCDNTHGMLPGLGVFPIDFEAHAPEDLSRNYGRASERPDLLFFAGKNHCGWHDSSMARPWLFRSYDAADESDKNDTLITSTGTSEMYLAGLSSAKFALVPRGDGRWNFRLHDVLRSGAVPVFLADGHEPPFGPLIRWEMCSVNLSEMDALDIRGMRGKLLKYTPEEIDTMASHAKTVYEECFQTPQNRSECLVRSLRILVRDGSQQQSPLEFAGRMRMPLCPSPKRHADDSGRVLYENNTFETWHKLY